MAARVSQLRKGILEIAVLAMLDSGETYGAELITRLGDLPGLTTSAGTVYPLLSRLEKVGLIGARWHPSDAGAPRKYYAITAEGSTHLHEQAEEWDQLHTSVNLLLNEVTR